MLRYVAHAERQIFRRGISMELIEEVATDPEVTYQSESNPNREVRVRSDGTRRIAVVIEPIGADELVITAFDQTTTD